MTIRKYNVYTIRITELVLREKHKYWTVVSIVLGFTQLYFCYLVKSCH